MAQGQNTAALMRFGFALLPSLVDQANKAHPEKGSGPQRDQYVKSALATALTIAGGAVALNNPGYASTISMIVPAAIQFANMQAASDNSSVETNAPPVLENKKKK